MTYKPRDADFDQKVEGLVKSRVDQILNSIKIVSSMYIEPGDIVLVQVDEEADESTLHNIQKLMSQVFTSNKGVLTSDSIDFKILRRGENNGYQEIEENKKLKEKVYHLEERLKSIEDAFGSKTGSGKI